MFIIHKQNICSMDKYAGEHLFYSPGADSTWDVKYPVFAYAVIAHRCK
jgi:hypothetical protein